jgi:hypothetical protein
MGEGGTAKSHIRTLRRPTAFHRPFSPANHDIPTVPNWHDPGVTSGVPFRTRIARTLAGTLIAFAALVSVGLTAPPDGPFTIDVRPVFFRLDPASIAESRAHALGLDVDVKFGTLHLHYAWSAIPLTPASTKPAGNLL